jgi:phosphorylase kinase alpha/beta subunit
MAQLYRINYVKLIKHHLHILETMQDESGLFLASPKGVSTGYDKAWLRDNFYECLAFEYTGHWDIVQKTYRAILDIFLQHEEKIDRAIAQKPASAHDYIHPRYNPDTFDEFWEEWGNKQHDAIGAILFKIGQLEQHEEVVHVLKTEADFRITQKLVHYLETIQYWQDIDNGMWEENEEVHASSVGACVAGLEAIAKVPGITIPEGLIQNGKDALDRLLPRESEGKFVDLAELSLIYPYNVVTPEQRDQILANVEYHLVKELGVLRYKGDRYYNADQDGVSQEAEWTFGLSWLAIIFEQMGNKEKADHYLRQSMATIDAIGNIPELYFSNRDIHNENSPLGWSESMFVVAATLFFEKHVLNSSESLVPDIHGV